MDSNTVMFLLVTSVPITLWVLKEFIKDFPVLFGKDEGNTPRKILESE